MKDERRGIDPKYKVRKLRRRVEKNHRYLFEENRSKNKGSKGEE